eukprot:680496-Rhodomonas_salina.1
MQTSAEQENVHRYQNETTVAERAFLGDIDSIAKLAHIVCVLMEMCFALYDYNKRIGKYSFNEYRLFEDLRFDGGNIKKREAVQVLKEWAESSTVTRNRLPQNFYLNVLSGFRATMEPQTDLMRLFRGLSSIFEHTAKVCETTEKFNDNYWVSPIYLHSSCSILAQSCSLMEDEWKELLSPFMWRMVAVNAAKCDKDWRAAAMQRGVAWAMWVDAKFQKKQSCCAASCNDCERPMARLLASNADLVRQIGAVEEQRFMQEKKVTLDWLRAELQRGANLPPKNAIPLV